ncbi:MAG: [LysW]-lysine hydrolase, partial [Thermomicrobiales bacterium]
MLSSAPEQTSDLSAYSAQEQADIQLLQGLVSIPSLSRQESHAVAFLRGAMAARGFRILESPAGNAVGTVGSGEKHIVLLGHIDTVPGEIPVRIEDGVLWGRGAVDAKGPLATFVAAASAAADELKAKITVVGAVGEEAIHSLGATEVATWDAPDFCIIGEPSSWDALCLGYRGSMSLLYRAEANMRHTAGPGESIGETAIAFWNALVADIAARNEGVKGAFDQIGLSLRAFNTASDGLTESAGLSIGIRLPADLDVPDLFSTIEMLAAAGGATVRMEGLQEGYRTTKQSKLVPPFLRAIREQGGAPKFKVKLGTSDMNVVGPVWKCPIAAYGPGDSSLDHTPDERIVLDEYLRAIRVLR